jgi:hypothetical protein
MSQININDPRGPGDRYDGDATVAAGINMMTVIIIGAVVIIAILALWWLVSSSGYFGPAVPAVPAVPAAPVSPARPVPTNPAPLPTVAPKVGDIVPFIASYFM